MGTGGGGGSTQAAGANEWRGTYGGPDTEGWGTATTQDEWAALWEPLGVDPPEALGGGLVGIGVFLGMRTTGGYGIVIDSQDNEGGTFVVRYSEVAPGPGAIVTMALTAPYVIWTIVDPGLRIVVFKSSIAKGEFKAVYQPIVDIRTRALHHHEALARFPSQGADASPYEMIRFAEEAGLIGDFDIAICKKVIATINAGRKTGKVVHAAVNLSGKSLESPMFVQELMGILRECRPIRNHLMFEVT
jgi:hypothetical protein